MAGWNGAGLFSYTYTWVQDSANGIPITDSRMDQEFADAAGGLMNCYTLDSQTIPKANLNMAGFRLTGTSAGVAASDSTNVQQVFTGPAFSAPTAVASPAAGDNSLLLATTQFVNGVAFSSALPAISVATENMFAWNNGTVGSWKKQLYYEESIRAIRHCRRVMAGLN
jgi:hypothetical protein